MSDNHWDLLDDLFNSKQPIQEIPPELMSMVAERLEDLIGNGSQQAMLDLSTQISGVFGVIVQNAPAEVLAAVRNTASVDSPASIAFMLGQLNFSHLLSAQVAERRAGQQFFDAMESPRYRHYITLLAQTDRSGVELAKQTEEAQETVSRKLKALRELGITDSRLDGRNVMNFLTPAARAFVRDPMLTDDGNPTSDLSLVKACLNTMNHKLDPYLQTSQTFSPPDAEVLLSVATW